MALLNIGYKRICHAGLTTWGLDISELTLERTVQTFDPVKYPVPIIPGHVYDEELAQRAMISAGSVPGYGMITGLEWAPWEDPVTKAVKKYLWGEMNITPQAEEEIADGLWLNGSVYIEPQCRSEFPPPHPADFYQVPVLCHYALIGANNQGISDIDSPAYWLVGEEQIAAENDKKSNRKFFIFTLPLEKWGEKEASKVIIRNGIMLSPGDTGGGGAGGGAGSGEQSYLVKAAVEALSGIWTKFYDALKAGDMSAAEAVLPDLEQALEVCGFKKEIEGAPPAPTPGDQGAMGAENQTLKAENLTLRKENERLTLERELAKDKADGWIDEAGVNELLNRHKSGLALESIRSQIATAKLLMGQPRYQKVPDTAVGSAAPSGEPKKLSRKEMEGTVTPLQLEADAKARGLFKPGSFNAEDYRTTRLTLEGWE